MSFTPWNTRVTSVSVEYDGKVGRVVKQFSSASAAKRFYVAKDKAGKHPKIVGATR